MTTAEKVCLNTPSLLTLELSLKCNQRCVHCYNDSGPEMGSPTDLTRGDFLRLITEGAQAGFTRLQLTGGEVMLYPDLSDLIRAAHERDYITVEVYSNLSVLPPAVLRALVDCKASAATSFYSDRPEVHARIIGCTERYWHNTVTNIRRIVEARIPLRAGVILMNENLDRVNQTVEFLEDIGVKNIEITQVQGVGRAAVTYPVSEAKDGLCGACCYGSLSIDPQGKVHPCSIGRAFTVGDVKRDSLVEIAAGERTRAIRRELYEHFTSKGRAGKYDNGCAVRCTPDIDNDLGKCTPARHSYRISNRAISVHDASCMLPPDRCSPHGDAIRRQIPRIKVIQCDLETKVDGDRGDFRPLGTAARQSKEELGITPASPLPSSNAAPYLEGVDVVGHPCNTYPRKSRPCGGGLDD